MQIRLSGEVLTTSFCDADTKGEAVCCPNSSYASFNGQCVLESMCPDILRGAPVWQPLSNAGEEYIKALDQSLGSEGYCCHPALSGGPLCSGSVGCYLSSGTAPEVFDPFSEYCADDECVLPLCQDSVNFSLCEESEVVTERTFSMSFDKTLNDSVLCDSYSVTESPYSCFPTYNMSSCSDVSQCDVVNVTVCEPNAPDECVALCEDERDKSTCTEVCSDGFACQTYESLRGPCECASPTGEVCGSERVIDNVDADGCTSAVKCTNYGCTLNSDNCDNCSKDGCDPSCGGFSYEDRFTRDITVCGDTLSCNANFSRFSSENVKCVGTSTSKNGSLLINASTDLGGMTAVGGSSLLQCSDNESNVFQGDGLCPKGYVYSKKDGLCLIKTDVCDFGSPDNLDNGCDNLTTGSDYWGLYNDDCISQKGSSAPQNVYNWACCYDSSFNDLDIYQGDTISTNVKVY